MKTCAKLQKINKLSVPVKLTVPSSETLPSTNEMVYGNDGKLDGDKFLISDVNHCNINDSNGDQELVGSIDYGDILDSDHDKSIEKLNENKTLQKTINGVNDVNVNVNNVTVRPQENLYNQSEIRYQNVKATPNRYHNINTTSDNQINLSINGYFTLTVLYLITSSLVTVLILYNIVASHSCFRCHSNTWSHITKNVGKISLDLPCVTMYYFSRLLC